MPVRRVDAFERVSADRWFRVATGFDEVRIELGVIGNRLDPQRRALRSAWLIRRAADRVVVLSVWPATSDVTDTPGRWADGLVGHVGAAGGSTDDLEAAVSQVRDLLPDCTWQPDPWTPAAHLTGLIHPLLRPCLDRGAIPPPVIPSVALPLLRARTPRDAARRLARRVTRPLVRAFADALLPDRDGAIRWDRMLAAAVAAPTCGPEQLTAILGCDVAEPGRFSIDENDLRRATGRVAGTRGRAVAEELLAHLERPGGADEYLRQVRLWDPRPPRVVVPPAVPPPPAAAPAPIAPAPAPEETGLRYPASIAELDGTELLPGISIVLPRTPEMLVEWGGEMANCLSLYRELAMRGATTIIGLRSAKRLRYILEVSPSGVLHQFESPANGRPPSDRREAIVAELRRRGIVDVDAAR